MQCPRYLPFIVLFVSLFSLSCGDGGGGSGSNSSQDPELTRAQLFAEEAIFRVTDRVTFGCDFIECGGIDSEHFVFVDNIFRTVIEACQYRCLPVEIDESGEVRHYLVKIQWDRAFSNCFDPNDGQVTLLAEVPVDCEPTL